TGLPLAGIPVGVFFPGQAVSDQQGLFAFSGVSLGANNSPIVVQVASAGTAVYWNGYSGLTTVWCGIIPNVEIQAEPRRWGTFSGRVDIGQADPNTPTTLRGVTDTGVPLVGAQAFVNSSNAQGSDTTNAQGNWHTVQMELDRAA